MRPPYCVENLAGNFHAAVAWINEHHPEWEIVAMYFTGVSTMVVYRVFLEEDREY